MKPPRPQDHIDQFCQIMIDALDGSDLDETAAIVHIAFHRFCCNLRGRGIPQALITDAMLSVATNEFLMTRAPQELVAQYRAVANDLEQKHCAGIN